MRQTDAPEQREMHNSEQNTMAMHVDVQRMSVRDHQRAERRGTP